ncbi:hypothetical protein BHE90_016007 [Fusarium euwallaceae]|uniref:Uncharacterized protein n=1 Tax=Fusarium euwallaceae TaxID=1147111 RepID=A0A430L1P4_9HYPO|nr:hypothetical protein BHE90_016007 [Fusarium euwallaceae]
MDPVRKPAGCIRLGAVGAYNFRGSGGVQGSRVQLAATPSDSESGSDDVARDGHKCVPCRRVLLLLVKALQFALYVEDPTRDQKEHTANLCRALKTQMEVLDEDSPFFEPTVNGRIGFGLDITEKDCLLVTQVDGAPSAPIDGTGVDIAAEADHVKRMLSDAVNEIVS